MQLTILRRLVAATVSATAVAATTATLTVVPALTAPATAAGTVTASSASLADSSLSIRAIKVAIRPGASSTIRGRLATPGAEPSGRTVLLEARSEGTPSFTPIATSTTGDAGMLKLKVQPETTTHYRWRYAGGVDASRAVSGVTRVRVRLGGHQAYRIRTTLSIRLKEVGDDLRVRGKLFNRAGLPGRRWVILTSRPAGATEWGFASAARTDVRGRVVFGVEPQAQTAYRLAFLGTPKLRPSRSGRVVVRTASEVSISAVPGIIDPGGSSTVAGVVTASGAAIPGATVNLISKTMRKGATWVTTDQSATTGADGTVSFAVTPDRSTSYRLRVVHTQGVRAGISASADVIVRAGSSVSIRGRSGVRGYVVEGQLRAAGVVRAGRTITLQSVAPGTTDWASVATATTNNNGHVEFVQPLVEGTQYRLAYEGEELYLPSVSGTVVS